MATMYNPGDKVIWMYRPKDRPGRDIEATVVKINPKMVCIYLDHYRRNVPPESLRPLGDVGQGHGELL